MSQPTNSVADVCDSQSEIGWIKILQGRFVSKWTELQSQHCDQMNKTKHDGNKWTTIMIRTMFQWCTKHWRVRNACKHGQDASKQAEILRERTKDEMRAVCNLKHEALSRDKDVFFNAFDEHMAEKSTVQMRTWMSAWKPTIVQSVKHAKSWAIKGARTINNYFQFQPD